MALAGGVARTRRRALRMFLIALIAAAGLVFAAQAAHAAGSATGFATGAASKGAISVTIDNGRLTLSAPGASLDRVLRTIGAEAGFKVIIKGDLSATPSRYTAMTRVPLGRALRRLVGGTSMVIVYEPPRNGVPERIAEVRLYARSQRAPRRRGPRRQRSPKTRAAVPGPAGRRSVHPSVTGFAPPSPGDKETLWGERDRGAGSDRTGQRTLRHNPSRPAGDAFFWSFFLPTGRPSFRGGRRTPRSRG